MSAFAERSETIGELSKALVKAVGEIGDIPKNKTVEVRKKDGGRYGFKYADLTDVINIVRPVLAKNGVAVLQTAETDRDTVSVWTTILHESGEYITHQATRMPSGNDAQGTGSSITYARRYSLLAVLGLSAEDDTDAGNNPAWKEPDTPKTAPKPRKDDPFFNKKSNPTQSSAKATLNDVGFTSADKFGGPEHENKERAMLAKEVGNLRGFSPLCAGNTKDFLTKHDVGLVTELPLDKLNELHTLLKGCAELGPDAEFAGGE